MKNKVARLVVILSGLLSAINVQAIDNKGKYAIKGVGNTSCEQFVSMTTKNDPQRFLFAGWLNGYMTAHNQHLKDSFDIVSWENVETLGNYLLRHCQKNPNISFFQATTQLLSEMYATRVAEFVGAQNIGSGQQSQKVYVQVIQRVQTRLAELGLYQGEVDGKISKKLMEATQAFRKSKSLPAADYLDQRVLHALLRAK